MRLQIQGSVLITSDATGSRRYDLDARTGQAEGLPVLVAAHPEPSTLNPFRQDPCGEALSEIRGGCFARGFTRPGRPDHWTAQPSQIGVYDLSLTQLACLEPNLRLSDTSLALSPDASQVAAIHYGAGIQILDVATGRTLHTHPGQIGSGVSWSADGRWLAAGDTGQGGGELYLLEHSADGPLTRHALARPSSRVPLLDASFCSTFSPDGRHVAFSSVAWGRRGITVYEVISGTERWAHRLPTLPGEGEEEEHWQALSVAYASGGAVLLVGIEEGCRAYRASDGTPLPTLPCAGASTPYFAPHDAGRRVYYTRGGELASEPYPATWP